MGAARKINMLIMFHDCSHECNIPLKSEYLPESGDDRVSTLQRFVIVIDGANIFVNLFERCFEALEIL